MGVSVVLLFWAVVGVVLATLGAAVFGCVAAILTRGATSGRRKAVIPASLFPFASLGWVGAVFVFQAVVNVDLFNRDLGVGDEWHAPLPNGYHILMIDVTDRGWVYNPKTQLFTGAVTDQVDAISDVRFFQVVDRYILGAADTKALDHLGTNTDRVDSYFILDTQTGRRTQFNGLEALQEQARALGAEPRFEPIYTVYSRLRFGWFDVFVLWLFLLPPALAFLALLFRILHVRRNRVLTEPLIR